ncbi:hybrid sensor histidine kinase/response regulator [Maridesulfovibrio bastinii]|uniref:hybrid sensor histidine kinase/response regulator n=1 Tax=Maridesulfovibrio bastinii TaxID=47157 RepID=UPI00040091B9|nr:HAMP domain-containing sensor histidine kinase [Maridesulfovibrio bastinii]
MQHSNEFAGSADDYLFFDDDKSDELFRSPGKWRVLVVDDEPDVHSVTRLVLSDYIFEGRRLEFVSVFSGKEALDVLSEQHDFAVVLLDVVMETDSAGLDVARRLRNELKNRLIRIILRTGQPGAAPEHKVIMELDINDYRQKTELTAQRLSTSITTALRSYRDLKKIEENRIRLARLAMSVAHQIRNRTMSISGFVSLAERKLDKESKIREYLKTVTEEAARLEGMVASVSEYAAIENSSRSVIGIFESISVELDRLNAYADLQHVKFDLKFDGNEKNILVNYEYFCRAVFELCRNCIDFSFDNAVTVTVSVNCDSCNCHLCFSDNARGIDKEDLPYIYDPFYTTKTEGVGMGLSLVQRIAEEHGWDIDIESDKGKGTKVFLVIPVSSGVDSDAKISGRCDYDS